MYLGKDSVYETAANISSNNRMHADSKKRTLVDLSDAYALCAARADFDRKLVQFMARHGKRGALVRRLADAGLWKKSSR